MHRVLLLGGGKIGRMIATLLARSGDYRVRVGDVDSQALGWLKANVPEVETRQVDASNKASLLEAMKDTDSVLSALAFAFNVQVAQTALEAGLNYFDLTEDVETARRIRELAAAARPGQIFMPQCGLAPGFISLVAHHLARSFDQLDFVKMRVGALPQYPTNALRYNLTWSTDGLINEYCNPCDVIQAGIRGTASPLQGLEQFSLDGVRYEAFNTSGGIGSLCEAFEGRVRELNYKTIRYVGHRDLMALLLFELRLSERRELLKDILEHAIPLTHQDVVVVFCTVSGWRQGELVQISDSRKIYQRTIAGESWTGIQITTASAICAMLDLHVAGKIPTTGFVRQEQVDWDAFLQNRFGSNYQGGVTTRHSRHEGGLNGENP